MKYVILAGAAALAFFIFLKTRRVTVGSPSSEAYTPVPIGGPANAPSMAPSTGYRPPPPSTAVNLGVAPLPQSQMPIGGPPIPGRRPLNTQPPSDAQVFGSLARPGSPPYQASSLPPEHSGYTPIRSPEPVSAAPPALTPEGTSFPVSRQQASPTLVQPYNAPPVLVPPSTGPAFSTRRGVGAF